MKITAVALSLAIAAAAGGTSVVTSTSQPSMFQGMHASKVEVPRDSRVCRWLGRSDADSTVRLWFACRR
ncbi:MAG: hypothetical protein JNL89_12950 [Rhodanobacteraceae bacterium]|nr:hypothetical protein [Rhodanobacteraceae bacterium]